MVADYESKTKGPRAENVDLHQWLDFQRQLHQHSSRLGRLGKHSRRANNFLDKSLQVHEAVGI